MPQHSVDVAVIGAGLAGLVTARDVAAAGLDVLVLEARNRVGGRMLNTPLPGADGEIVEAGGQWVGPGQDRIASLITELGLATFPTYDTGDKLAELRGSRTRYGGRVPRLNPAVIADIGQSQVRLDRAARRVPLDAPWTAPGAARLDGQTFATWLNRRAATASGRAFSRLVTEAVWAAEPEDMSALWALFYIHSGGGVDSLINTAGGAQQDRIVGGSQRIALELAAALGDRVVTGAPVTEVAWDGSGVLARAGGTQVRARRAVLAVPPPLAARVRFDPGLPAERDQLTQRMPMGWTIKVNVVYDEPFWRADGLAGQANSDVRPLGTVFDNTPPAGRPGVLVGFFEGAHAQAAAGLGEKERRDLAVADLVAYFGPRAGNPAAYLELDWAAEEYSRGCYGAFATPGTLTRYGRSLRPPIGPLHWAGTETALRWAGYMDGAAESGRRAAREVITALAGG
ncbi:MAG TPA: flavin monoamine oxidase family protein [Streptosporangiaceae bacterium]|nr:flavin monoamine oxidase family protein [Streptosporangiaceae bacterium]